MKHIKLFENNNQKYYVYTIQNYSTDTVKVKLFDTEESCIKYTIEFIHEYDMTHNDNYDCENIVNYDDILEYWNSNYYNAPVDFNYEEYEVETYKLSEKLELLYNGDKFNL